MFVNVATEVKMCLPENRTFLNELKLSFETPSIATINTYFINTDYYARKNTFTIHSHAIIYRPLINDI